MAKDWMKKLQKLEGAIVEPYNPFNHVIASPSPSLNFTFGNSWGLPLGFTLLLFGPQKSGKTLIANAMVGQMHKDDPEGIAIKFDTEFREHGQMTDEYAKVWGIDRDRYLVYQANQPSLVFDRIERDIAAQCQDGMPLRLVIIDSLTNVRGRRSLNADTIDTQQIGDHAITVQEGLQRILPVQRKYKFAVILTDQVRAQLDLLEQKRGNKIKPHSSFGVLHFAEYSMLVEPNRNVEGRTDLLGQEFRDGDMKDMKDNEEKTAHKIRAKMMDSSLGPKERVAEFTLDYHRGIINTHEEVFLLGKNRGVIIQPNQVSYQYGDRKWHGKPAMIQALKEDTDLYNAVLKDLRKLDLDAQVRP